ncbi:MAG: heme biosynthesis operon protein HemX [Nitrosomonadales bacterium]|nr:MAG: heme biosynthesis operon protein HemX [Nitrosomonadales bacterium]
MSDNDTQIPLPVPQAAKPNHGLPLAQIAVTIGLAALLLAGWQWLDSRQRFGGLEQALTQRLSEFDTRSKENQLLARQAEEATVRATARLALLEQKLDESHAQQEALQTLYLEMANNRDEWTIAEVEQLLIIASQQLQLAGNVKPALLALQTADARLQQFDKPQVIQLRKLISRDIQRLQALPSVDVVGMSLRLENLIAAADKIPLVSERHPKAETGISPDWNDSPWRRLGQEIWRDMKGLIRIQRIDRPEPPLLTPEQTFFLRENLKLRLLTARIALLQRDEASYRADLLTADSWIKQHFDTRDSTTQTALATLRQLSASDLIIQVPDIGETLNAVSKYKLALERPKK